MLTGTEYRAHHLIVYPDLATLRNVYSYYISSALNGKNEVVIMLPFYETTDSVRRILGLSKVDALKHEKQHSLIIMDSLKGYFGSEGVRLLIDQTIDHAKKTGKNGASAFGDMGSFFHQHKENNNLIEHELSLPSKHADGMNLKTFCLYHKQEFDKRLSNEQKEKLLQHHGKNMIIATA
jgi:MEDS: MEthanogen/methylotroph, DcmR Sensory domain